MPKVSLWAKVPHDRLPATRADAITAGADRFFTGQACARGHVMPRYVSSNGCSECQRENSFGLVRDVKAEQQARVRAAGAKLQAMLGWGRLT